MVFGVASLFRLVVCWYCCFGCCLFNMAVVGVFNWFYLLIIVLNVSLSFLLFYCCGFLVLSFCGD